MNFTKRLAAKYNVKADENIDIDLKKYSIPKSDKDEVKRLYNMLKGKKFDMSYDDEEDAYVIKYNNETYYLTNDAGKALEELLG